MQRILTALSIMALATTSAQAASPEEIARAVAIMTDETNPKLEKTYEHLEGKLISTKIEIVMGRERYWIHYWQPVNPPKGSQGPLLAIAYRGPEHGKPLSPTVNALMVDDGPDGVVDESIYETAPVAIGDMHKVQPIFDAGVRALLAQAK